VRSTYLDYDITTNTAKSIEILCFIELLIGYNENESYNFFLYHTSFSEHANPDRTIVLRDEPSALFNIQIWWNNYRLKARPLEQLSYLDWHAHWKMYDTKKNYKIHSHYTHEQIRWKHKIFDGLGSVRLWIVIKVCRAHIQPKNWFYNSID